jgi:hypothetical protein
MVMLVPFLSLKRTVLGLEGSGKRCGQPLQGHMKVLLHCNCCYSYCICKKICNINSVNDTGILQLNIIFQHGTFANAMSPLQHVKLCSFLFRFEKIFDQQSQQDEVFDAVAKPVIDKYVPILFQLVEFGHSTLINLID